MSENINRTYNTKEIMEVLPHRYPILLLDGVTEITDEGGKGFKNVTAHEPVFQGHFPLKPIYPGVYIVEGLAQCSGFIALKLLEKMDPVKYDSRKEKLIYFMMIDNVKFRRMVLPEDKLDYEITIIKLSPRIAKFKGVAKVGGELAAEAEMTAMMDIK